MNIEDNIDMLLELSPLTDFYDHGLVTAIEEIKCTKLLQIVKLHEIDLDYLRTQHDQCLKSFKNASYSIESLTHLNTVFDKNSSNHQLEANGFELLNKHFFNILYLERSRLAPLIRALESIIKEFEDSYKQVCESLNQIHIQNDYHNCITNDDEKLGKLFAIRGIIKEAQNHIETCEFRLQVIQSLLDEANEFQNSILNPFVIENKKLLIDPKLSVQSATLGSESSLLKEIKRKLTLKKWIMIALSPFVGAAFCIPAYLLLIPDQTLFYEGLSVIAFLFVLVGVLFSIARFRFPVTVNMIFLGLCCSLFFHHQFHDEIEAYFLNNAYLYALITIGLFSLVYGIRSLSKHNVALVMLKLIESPQINESIGLTK